MILLECVLSNANWGTVPDWAMIVVTVITAVFLYQTLSSQKKVQKLQQKLTKLELKRAKGEMMPTIKIKRKVDQHTELEDHVKMLVGINFKNNSKNPLYDLEFKTIVNNGFETPSTYFQSKNDLSPGDGFTMHFHKDAQKVDVFVLKDFFLAELQLRLEYKDRLGNKYYQKITYFVAGKNNINFYVTPPREVK